MVAPAPKNRQGWRTPWKAECLMDRHVIVIGKTGQLAQALQRAFPQSSLTASFMNRQALDLADTESSLKAKLEKLPPCDAIILAAAYTAVDKAESEFEEAMAVNGRGPKLIAAYCKDKGIPLIHISTDYVFNGQATEPYKITNKTDPINAYGISKRAGEIAIEASGCNYAILRTSWVFDGRNRNFLTTMLRLAETRKTLNVVSDQLGRPTYAGHLAQAVINVTNDLINGEQGFQAILHVTNTGPTISWADFARNIFQTQGLDVDIKSISTEEYPTPAKRPAFSALDTSKFESLFAYKLPNWQAGLKAAIAERN